MKKNSAYLLEQIATLEKLFFALSTRLSQVASELQSPGIPPSESFVKEIAASYEKFADLRTKVIELAESLAVLPAQEIKQILSLYDLKFLLTEVVNKETQKSEFEEVRVRAFKVIDRVLNIATCNGSDCPPLQQCQQQARELRCLIAESQSLKLHPDIEELANERHPFAALLTLVERRRDGDYRRRNINLQRAITESFPDFGEELSMAAVMGDFSISLESMSESSSASADKKDCANSTLMQFSEPETSSSKEQILNVVDVPISPEAAQGSATSYTVIENTASAKYLSSEITSQALPEAQVVIIEETVEDSSITFAETGVTPNVIEVVEDETLPVPTEFTQNETLLKASQITEQPEPLDEDTYESSNSILQERYQLQQKLDTNDDVQQFSESWLGQDEDCSEYLIKLQRYQEKQPNEVLRRIWDNQLRTLYRLSSSPGAEESLLTLHDAGIDRTQRAFVMVLKSDCNGYDTLATALANRQDSPWKTYIWLQVNQIRKPDVRKQIWHGLRRLATGIQLLHRQQVLHRNICAENIFFARNQGTDSWRLGGFEWSVRLGNSSNSSPDQSWSIPPEFSEQEATGYSFDTDWYGFGMLAARCFYKGLEDKNDLEGLKETTDDSPAALNQKVWDKVEANFSQLSPVEYRLIQRLIARCPEQRLSFSLEILREIDEIVDSLNTGISATKKKQPLRLAFNPKNEKISDAARQAGFVPNPSKEDEDFNLNNTLHVSQLKEFLRKSFESAKLYPIPGKNSYVLVGRITLLIDQYSEISGKAGTWDIAYAVNPSELRGSDGNSIRELRDASIDVITLSEARTGSTKSNSQSWSSFLPNIDEKKFLREPLAKFREFLQCTNQLELLMRDAEIFAYNRQSEEGSENIFINERERVRPVAEFCQVKDGMLEFLQREWDSGRKDCKLFLLCDEDSLRVSGKKKNEAWEIVQINREQGYAQLRRAVSDRVGLSPVPDSGYLRSWNHYAQIKVIERRKNAIDRLEDHSYLLQALAAPRLMDTKWIAPLERLDQADVDISKKAVIQDILRVRPIYTLQGPPGTGKTTLVAQLLREIINEDPVAQILVTAQAHPAVDVLRNKVWNEAFHDVDDAKKPIAVRLGVGDSEDGNAEGTVEKVSRDLLQQTKEQLSNLSSRSKLQQEWYEILTRMLNAQSPASERAIPDFQDLVKRGANITYCTTSAGSLEELAKSNQSFDWSIVEEAGKAHGFELALPLQAGHRWMLLGDHKQLPPYRFNDYLHCLENLDQAVEYINDLPRCDRSLLDFNWLQSWQQKNSIEQSNFIKYAKDRLTTFEYIFEKLRTQAYGKEKITTTQSEGAASGRLSLQYRMHPTIGDLIFQTFYNEDNLYEEENIYNKAVMDDEGMPKSRVRHPFVAPSEIKDKAVVWIDVPWCADDPKYEEKGEKQSQPRYTNPFEVQAVQHFLSQLRYEKSPESSIKVAVLSPYSQQVALLRKKLRDTQLPHGVTFTENLRVRKPEINQASSAHSVDSFQGNEADVVIISLVRNNRLLSQDGLPNGLGFLSEVERLNVMLSRAEKMLVLVGCWQFFEWSLKGVNIDNRSDSLWEWKKILQMFTEAFDDGRAIKIPYSKIVKDV
jgi:serine/threonine protein kinase